MGRIEYRAAHTRSPWRKVGNHSSLEKAKYGPNGAKSLLTGGLPKRVKDYGAVSCVLVWEQGAAEGSIMRQSPTGGGVEERRVPMQAVLKYEAQGSIPAKEIADWFEAKPSATPSGTEEIQEPRATGRQDLESASTTKERDYGFVASPKPSGPLSVDRLEDIGRIRLSRSFFLRDFLHSEIAQAYGMQNVPNDLELAVQAGSKLCEELLEPIQARFGRIAIRSAYRSPAVNEIGNQKGHNCAQNERNYAAHIWDRRDKVGRIGATACIVVPVLVDYAEHGGSWAEMAWWIHDHLPYSSLQFFPRLLAFNVRWREDPERVIGSYIEPKGTLTKPGMRNHAVDHSELYQGLLTFVAHK